jgi:hypothetical protein
MYEENVMTDDRPEFRDARLAQDDSTDRRESPRESSTVAEEDGEMANTSLSARSRIRCIDSSSTKSPPPSPSLLPL